MPDDPRTRTFSSLAAPELAGLSVPLRAGPYFATGAGEPLVLGEFAAQGGHGRPRGERAGWARLGSDGGYEVCADGGGVVRAVLLDFDEPDRFVNSSAAAFAAGVADLDEALRVILATDRPQTAADAYARLAERLRERDAEAFGSTEHWWPLVLDDIRDTASVENYAAFEYVDAVEGKRIVTQAGAVALHPEERLWASLRAAGVEADQVLRVHTDLEPCFMPGHYCSMWLAQVFPEADMTHSFPYGESAESRAEGVRRIREYAAGGAGRQQ